MSPLEKDLAEVVLEVESKPECWTDTEFVLRRFIHTHHAEIVQNARGLRALEMAMDELAAWECDADRLNKRADEIMRGGE